MTKPLLCYIVDGNDDGESAEIIFAASSIEAKRDWSNSHWDGREIAGISARRQPQWDTYAPGPVPRLELIEAGWWMECFGCSVRIDSDSIGTSDAYTNGYCREDWDLDREYGPDLTLPVMQPVEPTRGSIWCRQECYDRDMAEERRIARMTARAIAICTAAVLRRWPGVTIVNRPGHSDAYAYVTRHSSGYLLIHDVSVRFEVPGMQHGGGSLHVWDQKWRYARERRPDDRDYRGYREHPLPVSARTREANLYMANGDKAVWDAWVAPAKPEYVGP